MMGQRIICRTLVLMPLVASPMSAAWAQPCQPQWSDQFGGSAGLGLTGGVGPRAFTLYDPDGGGPSPPALVVAGAFGTAGGVSTGNVALWNGSTWSGFNGGVSGVQGTAWDVTVFDDDGPGPIEPALYAAGSFFPAAGGVANRIARWNGSTWQPLGSGLNDTAFCLAVFDEDAGGPSPPRLFVGGEFTSAGGVPVNRIARWNGSTWSAVGAGLTIQVKDLYVFDDDGDGPNAPALFAAVDPAGAVYRWNGQSWTYCGGFIGGGVNVLTSVDHDGAGPSPPVLYAGGEFIYHGAAQFVVNYVAKYLGGTAWAAMDSGVLGTVRCMTAFDDDGTGPHPPALYVGGIFLTASGVVVNHIARWDGDAWSDLDGGLTPTYAGIHVSAVGPFDPDGAGPHPVDLYAGGFFGAAGGNSSYNIAAWLGCATPLPPGDIDGDGDVDGADRDLFVAVLLAQDANPGHVSRSDVNGDGVSDGGDIEPFVVILLSD